MYKYSFAESVNLDAVEASLVMAFLGAEALFGEAQVRLDASYAFDREKRTCVIDASTDVGRDVNRLFTNFLRREFDSGEFTVRRIEPEPTPDMAAA